MGKKYMYSMCIKGGLREWQIVYVKEREREREREEKCNNELECWPLLWPSVLVDMNHYHQRNCTHIPSPPAHPPLHIHQERIETQCHLFIYTSKLQL